MQIGSRLYWSNDIKYFHPLNEIISKKNGVRNGLWLTIGHLKDRVEKHVPWMEKAGGVVRTALPVSPKSVKLLEKLRNKLRIPNKTYQCDMEYEISRIFEQLWAHLRNEEL